MHKDNIQENSIMSRGKVLAFIIQSMQIDIIQITVGIIDRSGAYEAEFIGIKIKHADLAVLAGISINGMSPASITNRIKHGRNNCIGSNGDMVLHLFHTYNIRLCIFQNGSEVSILISQIKQRT